MSEQTKIQWADSTVNFWSGCTKWSDGCKNCYAEVMDNRHLIEPVSHWGKGAPRLKSVGAVKMALALNNKPFVCDRCGGDKMLAGSDGRIECKACEYEEHEIHRRRVFSLSRGDWLDAEAPIEWLAEMLDTVRQCENVDWLLVTKRPELWESRIEAVLRWLESNDCKWPENQCSSLPLRNYLADWFVLKKAPSNVMVLTSVENQKAADERIPALLKIPARWRGLSCEPLLEAVNLGLDYEWGAYQDGNDSPLRKARRDGIHWVIVGGESGPSARACSMHWVQDVALQCNGNRVPVFVKQLGKLAVCAHFSGFDFPNPKKLKNYDQSKFTSRLMTKDNSGGDMEEWPFQLRVREFYRETNTSIPAGVPPVTSQRDIPTW